MWIEEQLSDTDYYPSFVAFYNKLKQKGLVGFFIHHPTNKIMFISILVMYSRFLVNLN